MVSKLVVKMDAIAVEKKVLSVALKLVERWDVISDVLKDGLLVPISDVVTAEKMALSLDPVIRINMYSFLVIYNYYNVSKLLTDCSNQNSSNTHSGLYEHSLLHFDI